MLESGSCRLVLNACVCPAGVTMKLMDEVAGIVAARHCNTNVVTVAVDAINFHRKIKKGERYPKPPQNAVVVRQIRKQGAPLGNLFSGSGHIWKDIWKRRLHSFVPKEKISERREERTTEVGVSPQGHFLSLLFKVNYLITLEVKCRG